MLKSLDELHQSERTKNRLLSGVSDGGCLRPVLQILLMSERPHLVSDPHWIPSSLGFALRRDSFLNTLRNPSLLQFHLFTLQMDNEESIGNNLAGDMAVDQRWKHSEYVE